MLTGGYYFSEHIRVKEVGLKLIFLVSYHGVLKGYRIYNTWMGDPTKLFLLEKVIEVIKRDNLLQQAKDIGALFQTKLHTLQVF